MKLGRKNIEFMEKMECGKLADIEKKEIKVTQCATYIDKFGEKKVVFTIENDKKNYYYMPSSMVKYFDEHTIENINTGKDTIKGVFEKVDIGNGRNAWDFKDAE